MNETVQLLLERGKNVGEIVRRRRGGRMGQDRRRRRRRRGGGGGGDAIHRRDSDSIVFIDDHLGPLMQRERGHVSSHGAIGR